MRWVCPPALTSLPCNIKGLGEEGPERQRKNSKKVQKRTGKRLGKAPVTVGSNPGDSRGDWTTQTRGRRKRPDGTHDLEVLQCILPNARELEGAGGGERGNWSGQ